MTNWRKTKGAIFTGLQQPESIKYTSYVKWNNDSGTYAGLSLVIYGIYFVIETIVAM